MPRRSRIQSLRTALAVIAVLVLFGTTFVGAASAEPAGAAPQATENKEDAAARSAENREAAANHAAARQEPADPDVTEDNDTNDGGTPNNVPDDGDNRHPSGRDRSVEPGGSGNQGRSTSDPDDDGRGPDRSNGGPDKPDGSGGVDLADQDGNNGCGNDDDFEDDNEGWCLGRNRGVRPTTPPPPPPFAVTSPAVTSPAVTLPAVTLPALMMAGIVEVPVAAPVWGEVLGESVTRPVAAPAVASIPTPAGEVRAAGAVVSGAGAELAFTGTDPVTLLVAALLALAAGGALLRANRRRISVLT